MSWCLQQLVLGVWSFLLQEPRKKNHSHNSLAYKRYSEYNDNNNNLTTSTQSGGQQNYYKPNYLTLIC
jgi:hypothetical protein